LTGSSSQILQDKYRADETKDTQIHLNKKKIKALGYKERIGFNEGLNTTVEWYKHNSR
jgi:dTDP-D-glucose 4,6-dehydratase